MLEIKSLTKIYKNKVGADVKALDNISLKFPEKGMVFLLGKSGSGKSTLLNVCGGLDSPTSGEIIVKGRSSKKFSQSDFDSYRNTFVGFVFQEYNILNEFTVEENIALALELQNKQPDKNVVNELLSKVDLEGYGRRKPNTLSGGQKQRIAIARALIKSPEIIMADEPTGALDSLTGKQVLDTLKKLSKDILVIVVSHDREFAENYADRIIELKDGKVLSDVTKTNIEKQEISNNVSIVGDTLCIKSGTDLTDKDFSSIKEFMKTSSTDLVVSKSEKDIEAFKRVAKINNKGEKESFSETNIDNIKLKQYSLEESKFIKSKLPLKHAFKIGVSSMKQKPLRLFFTIILCSIAFILFGLFSTMTFYNSESTFKSTLSKSNYNYLKLSKFYKVKEISYYNNEKDYDFTSSIETPFYEEEYNSLKKKYGDDLFFAINCGGSYSVQKTNSKYYINRIDYIGYLEEGNELRKKITGEYPKEDNEILISSYTADVMVNSNVYGGKNNELLNLKTRNDAIGKSININGRLYKITGIIDSGELDPKFDELKDGNSARLQIDLEGTLSDELHLMAFVSKKHLKVLSQEYNDYYSGRSSLMDYTKILVKSTSSKKDFDSYASTSYMTYDKKLNKDLVLFKDDFTLNDNQVILSIESYADIITKIYEEKGANGDFSAWDVSSFASQLREGGKYSESGLIKYTESERIDLFNKLRKTVGNLNLSIDIKLYSDEGVSFGEVKTLEVVGVYTGASESYITQYAILNNNLYNKLWDEQKNTIEHYMISETKYIPTNSMYSIMYIPFENTTEDINELWEIYSNKKFKADDSKYVLSSYVVDNLAMVDEAVGILSKVFLYGGIILCVFAILLFSNFISVSISNKTREIGILRAVGARSIDVFKIFFSESFVITIICLILSIIASITICNILNSLLSFGVGVSIFVFGIVSFIVVIFVAFLSAFLSTYIPVLKAARKKPIDSIRTV